MAQTVFDLPLEAIRVPVLVVGHAADQCIRSPAGLMGDITARTNGARRRSQPLGIGQIMRPCDAHYLMLH